ncbi:MAG: methyltransferase [Ponticaulis sp.]|nr:methyltransferase [Ponticaulis sp.]
MAETEENPFLKSFEDPEAVANYHSGPTLFVPGFHDLHLMTSLLLAERVPADGRILVLGAGGGLELKALAQAQPEWTFEGVDPAGEMLSLARTTLGENADRVHLVKGYIDDASEGPFDGAVCLLTLHFLKSDERRRTLREIRDRLKPGAPFVAAHSCLPADPDERALWLDRYAAFARAAGAPAEMVERAKDGVSKMDTLYSDYEDLSLISKAGFSDVTLFYAALTWRGWVGLA